MKLLCVTFGIAYYVAQCFASEEISQTKKIGNVNVPNNFNTVDILLRSLNAQSWTEEDVPCVNEFLSILHNVKNGTLWATWIWDSMPHSPVGVFYGSNYQMGSYEQCLNAPLIPTQYCLANLKIAESEEHRKPLDPYGHAKEYFKTQSDYGKKFNVIVWALCMPQICNSMTVAKVAALMLVGTHIATDSAPQVSVEPCLTLKTESTPLVSYAGLLSTVLLLVISTIFIVMTKCDINSIAANLSNIFSVRKNWDSLFKEYDGEIKPMNGIRFLTAFIVIFIHGYSGKAYSILSNYLVFEKESFLYKLHLDIVVDTFFFMSGFLLIKGYMTDKKKENLIKSLLKRYLRLAGPLALCIYILVTVDGVHTLVSQSFIKFIKECCVENWWMTLFMINTSIKKLCYGLSWYIICDFQLAVLATILYYLYQKNKSVGMFSFGVATILSILIPGLITYNYQFVPLTLARHMETISYDYMELIYVRSYSRAGPYLVGMAAGYVVTLYKPQKNINMKWSLPFFALSLTTMAIAMCWSLFFWGRNSNVLELAIHAGLSRSIWAIGVWGVIWFCQYGKVPVITSFLSWSFFRPLSRLSYGIYLIHGGVVSLPGLIAQQPLTYNMAVIILETCGAAVISIILSLFMWLTIEAPIINICKHYI